MLQYTQLILEQNNAHDSRYQSLIGVMDDIWNETVQATSPLLRFGFAMADKLVKAIQLEALFTPTCYLNADIEELKAANAALYEELSPNSIAPAWQIPPTPPNFSATVVALSLPLFTAASGHCIRLPAVTGATRWYAGWNY